MRDLLESEGLVVVGTPASGAEAVRIARELRPDLALVDIDLGEESGFDVVRMLDNEVRPLPRQVAAAILTLLLISVVAFGMMSVRTPEDIARKKFGPQITAEQIEAFAQEYRLDQPVVERYGDWLWTFLQGDMGTSYVTDTSVSDDVLPRF